MKLKKFALIADIVGAFAIVLTLVLLLVEVRDNTRAIEISTRQSVATRSNTLALFVTEHPELNETLAKLENGLEVTDRELTNLQSFAGAQLRLAEEAYLLYIEGRLDESYWATRGALAVGILSTPEMRDYYEQARDRGWFVPEFAHWIDANVYEDLQ